ncbi:MAG: lysophospholipid acyltransferase family protein [Dehalococcoidia bacterium]|nr:lysophospholipid acyltransferase family protein [Dehalococcoidia bacterium]
MLAYIIFRLACLVVPWIPARIGYALFSLVGDVTYLVAKPARAAVEANLTRVLGPDADGGRFREITRQVFRNGAKNYFDLFRLPRLHVSQIERILTIHHWERLEQALAQGRGLILATAHFGNFDMVGQILAGRSFRVTALAEPLEPPRLFRLVTALRNSQGLSFEPVGPAALRSILRALRRGEIVGLACDRDLQGNGLRLPFFGEETRLPAGAIYLAVRTGAPVVPAFVVRQRNNTFTAFIEEPLDLDGADSEEEAVRLGTGKIASLLESYISRYPDQWLVFDPVWKETIQRKSGVYCER